MIPLDSLSNRKHSGTLWNGTFIVKDTEVGCRSLFVWRPSLILIWPTWCKTGNDFIGFLGPENMGIGPGMVLLAALLVEL
jgi:hypothetical protein